MKFLFEVSWEVCNKVGGIYTVIQSKLSSMIKEFGENCLLIGPSLDHNTDFVDTQDPFYEPFRETITKKGLQCRYGRWLVNGEPKVILVDYRNYYDVTKLLFQFWNDYGVDSYSAQWDYIEPVLFSTACGEIIEIIHQHTKNDTRTSIAHFHEWMCGGGLLYLKKHAPDIGTVFTTHATTLGRSLASHSKNFYSELEGVHPEEAAKIHHVIPKHSMEKIAAKESDCFTTVSDITATESKILLSKSPEQIVYNGFQVFQIKDHSQDRHESLETKRKLLALSEKFLQRPFSENTKIFIISGRYEFRNKGYDIFLRCLSNLEQWLSQQSDAQPVIALVLAASGHKGLSETVHSRMQNNRFDGPLGITTHRLSDEYQDPIVKMCYELRLNNDASNKVSLIFCPAYLDGHDGFFNMHYYEVLQGCDVGVFPSFYEPWGYTPLESIAYSLPTITTDAAGFGQWAAKHADSKSSAVIVIPRVKATDEEVCQNITERMKSFIGLSDTSMNKIRQEARLIAEKADWSVFFREYMKAYGIAGSCAYQRSNSLDTTSYARSVRPEVGTQLHTEMQERRFSLVPSIPDALWGLKDLAYNILWSWKPEILRLFELLDSETWRKCKNNPVTMLHNLSYHQYEAMLDNDEFMSQYHQVITQLNNYLYEQEASVEAYHGINRENPIAYFSMEFGLHECLPIYSGGLGVLAGDHLKSASDLNIPLVGIGLLYKQGYFEQRIERNGMQTETYPLVDVSQSPVMSVRDEQGNDCIIALDFPGRVVYVKVWQVRVGRVILYLFDTDVSQNSVKDRTITHRLYGGDKIDRIKQEIVLGLGGVKFLQQYLKLRPSVYHLNEGHCSFLLLERLKRFTEIGLSYSEAREAVRASSVFTTHTPVPAGNEEFDVELIRYHFESFVQNIGITFEQLLELGLDHENKEKNKFSMTVLALKLTSHANAVSKLHGTVSRKMWKHVWHGINENEIPVVSITNGVHIASWIGRDVKHLYESATNILLEKDSDNVSSWSKIGMIPNEQIWAAHKKQKELLLEYVRKQIIHEYGWRGEDPKFIKQTLGGIHPDALTIGFARRAAPYKRAHLLFYDLQRLVRILNQSDMPLQIIMAGKSHPADGKGKDIIKEIMNAIRDKQLQGKIIFLENYNMALSRKLVQGVDLWLNNPIRPYEACGTSGMKVIANGGLNLSILDGWWAEAYNEEVGFAVDSGNHDPNNEFRDQLDNMALMDILEYKIIPMFHARDSHGIPLQWMKIVQSSIASLVPKFSSARMVKEYYHNTYLAAAKREELLYRNHYQDIKELTAWKSKIRSRFSSLVVRRFIINGIKGELLSPRTPLCIEIDIDPGSLLPEELLVEMVMNRHKENEFSENSKILQFDRVSSSEERPLLYRLEHQVSEIGNYHFGIRILPYHALLGNPRETGLVHWI